MPAPRRTVNGETREWNGSSWAPVRDSAREGTPGLFSGGVDALMRKPVDTAKDLYHGLTEHPADTIGGFFKGAAEGAPTAARIAQTAAPLLTGGASIPVQMAVGGGTQLLTDLADTMSGDARAPQSFGDWAWRGASGAGLAGAAGVVGKGIGAIANRGGMVNTALDAAEHLPFVGKYATLAKAARSFLPEGEAAAEAVPASRPAGWKPGPSRVSKEVPYSGNGVPEVGGNVPNKSGIPDSWERPYSPSMSPSDTPEVLGAISKQNPAPNLVKGGSLEDHLSSVLDGIKGSDTAGDVAKLSTAAPEASTAGEGAFQFENKGGDISKGYSSGNPSRPVSASPSPTERLDAMSDNLSRNSNYGDGGVMPNSMRPTEFPIEEVPRTPDERFFDGLPEPTPFTHEAGNPDIPGLTIGESPAQAPKIDLASRPSVQGLAPVDDPNGYAKWAGEMDDIVNATKPEEIPQSSPTNVYRTRAYKDWMQKRMATVPPLADREIFPPSR